MSLIGVASRRLVDVLDLNPGVILAWPRTRVIDECGAVTRDYRTDLPFDIATPSTRLRSLLGRKTDESLLHMCYPMYGAGRRRDTLLTTHLMGDDPQC